MNSYLKLILISLCVFAFYSPASTNAVYQASATQSHEPSYVPDQVIVKYKPGLNPVELKRESGDVSLNSIERTSAMQNYAQIKQFNQSMGVTNADAPLVIMDDVVLYKTNGTMTVDQMVDSYNKQKNIEYAEPNYILYPLKTPNDSLFGQMWGLSKMNLTQAWDTTIGSKNIKVALIDSGAERNHPDLKNNIVEAKSFCGGFATGSHGTHTSGTVGAVGNNSSGVTGVNWEVGLMSLDVFCGGGGGGMNAIVSAIQYATSQGAKVINMSLGFQLGRRAPPQSLSSAIANAVNRGTTVVVASGNCGITPSKRGCGANPEIDTDNPPITISADKLYPASDPNVITVGATNRNDQLASFSSTGTSVDVSAPGQDIASTAPGGRYQNMSGTSMASPHVAGVVALLYAVNPAMSPSEAKSILESTAKDLGTPGRDRDFGAGRIDAGAAVARATSDGGGGSGNPTPTMTQPTSVVTPPPRSTSTPPKPTSPVSNPTPTPRSVVNPTPPSGNCKTGDFNCDGTVDKQDFEDWKSAFIAGNATLRQYNEWRKAIFTK